MFYRPDIALGCLVLRQPACPTAQEPHSGTASRSPTPYDTITDAAVAANVSRYALLFSHRIRRGIAAGTIREDDYYV
ncbi:hypothetical protein CLV84_1435 [Neolewinella xylanilytica]|uniref:Uncharacterized protein n=1 Tax=Neolewinella xylanilytica TaxID=1514080 RepID=A0A2S6IAD3_9BACT|nr:hypothetical protein [Neolewinella xylanilytica]PPK88467.1 hypothetical protein CLV84_1435 [Neolewinella xylanilytica]